MDAHVTRLSIVVPTLDEAANIETALRALAPLRARGVEIIVTDGGSGDRTREFASELADAVITSPRGRATQMNAGARRASGDVLLFLHADTVLPEDADTLVSDAVADNDRQWGFFSVAIMGTHWLLPVVARMMSWRSRATQIATGDQALFVSRSLFERAGGYPEIPLMEDIALTRTLKSFCRPCALKARVHTSGRRWQEHGVLKTVLLMWRLRFAYWCGVSPDELAPRYAPHNH